MGSLTLPLNLRNLLLGQTPKNRSTPEIRWQPPNRQSGKRSVSEFRRIRGIWFFHSNLTQNKFLSQDRQTCWATRLFQNWGWCERSFSVHTSRISRGSQNIQILERTERRLHLRPWSRCSPVCPSGIRSQFRPLQRLNSPRCQRRRTTKSDELLPKKISVIEDLYRSRSSTRDVTDTCAQLHHVVRYPWCFVGDKQRREFSEVRMPFFSSQNVFWKKQTWHWCCKVVREMTTFRWTPPPLDPPDRPKFRSFSSLSRHRFALSVSLWVSSRWILVVFLAKVGQHSKTLKLATVGQLEPHPSWPRRVEPRWVKH